VNAAQRRLWFLVRERDDDTCQHCGQPGSEVHHIVSRRYKGTWALPNMLCLCRSCHKAASGVRARGILLSDLRAKYGYTYQDDPWKSILRLHDFVVGANVD